MRAEDKVEGDKKTPIGRWVMREVFYRPDRESRPETDLPCRALAPHEGWCENPNLPTYNRLMPTDEDRQISSLWRNDGLYDLIVVLGYNDDPPIPGKGSAIFLHCARPNFGFSAGCVSLARDDLVTMLRDANKNSAVVVMPLP